VSDPAHSTERFKPPPPQDNLNRAIQLAYDVLAEQTPEQLAWLGAEVTGGVWRLPVLNDTFEVDVTRRQTVTASGADVQPAWKILVLHYLAVTDRPEDRAANTTFADLANARSYAGIYQGRVIARLCATAGRNAETLHAAAESLDGHPIEQGDLGFDFRPLPRVTLRLVWHAPDEEFPPSATVLLPDNIESYLCSEDIVVLSEQLVARLGGRPF